MGRAAESGWDHGDRETARTLQHAPRPSGWAVSHRARPWAHCVGTVAGSAWKEKEVRAAQWRANGGPTSIMRSGPAQLALPRVQKHETDSPTKALPAALRYNGRKM